MGKLEPVGDIVYNWLRKMQKDLKIAAVDAEANKDRNKAITCLVRADEIQVLLDKRKKELLGE